MDTDRSDAATIELEDYRPRKFTAISTDELEDYRTRIGKLNERATKLGLEPGISIEVTNPRRGVPASVSMTQRYEDIVHSYGHDRARKMFATSIVDVELLGDRAHFDGWSFLAVIEHLDGGNLVLAAPGSEDLELERWRQVGNDCDHCGHDRARSKTMVLQHDDGRTTQVGTTCIKDFLGAAAPTPGRVAAWLQDLVDDEPGHGVGRQQVPPTWVLAVAAAYVRQLGWVSRRAAEGRGTHGSASDVGELIWSEKAWKRFDIERPTEEDLETADRVARWIRSEATSSEYVGNLAVLLDSSDVPAKRIGFLASAVASWQRSLVDLEERAARREAEERRKAEAEPVPTGREQVEGVVIKVAVRDSGYGPQLKMTVLEDRGFKVWGSVPGSIDVDSGDRVRFTAALEQSPEDPLFGFFKRPTKAEVLEAASDADGGSEE